MAKVNQHLKIKDLFNVLQNAHCLFFVMSTKLNRWEVKSDRNLFAKNNLKLYKTNTYRGSEIFNKIPFAKNLSQTIQGPFFIAYTDKQKNYNQLAELFNFQTKHMKMLLAIQNNTVFSKKRLILANKLPKKNILAWPTNSNPIYFLINKILLLLIDIVFFIGSKNINLPLKK